MLDAIKEHRRALGNRHYDDLRDRADFAAWIGTALGETGRKRFQRLVKKVSRPMPADRTKKHRGREANEDQAAWAADQARRANEASGVPIALSPAQVMAGGAVTLTGFHEFTEMLRNGPLDLELARQAAFADGVLVNPELLLKVCKEIRAWTETMDRLASRYASTFRTHQFAEKVMTMILNLFPDDPVKQSAALVALNAIIEELNGLPATSGSAL